RMEHTVMSFIRRFMAEKITVRSGFTVDPVDVFLFFSHRQRQRTVRITAFDGLYDLLHLLRGKKSVLAALKDKSAESKVISLHAAVKDILLRQPVSLSGVIASPDPAVITVVPAVTGKFDQSADVDIVSVYLLSHPAGQVSCILFCFPVAFPDHLTEFLPGKSACPV